MKPVNLKWTKEECHLEALKYNYKIDFRKQSYGAYQAAYRNKWFDDICSHMILVGNEYNRLIYRFIFPNKVCYIGLTSNFERRMCEHLNKGSVYSYIKNKNILPISIEKLTNYIPINEAKIQEEYWKCKSEEDGFKCINTAKTGGIGSFNLKWNKEECRKVANKYLTRFDFQQNNHSAYNSAIKNNWLYEICSHMIIKHKKWTKDECKLEALKYNSRGEYAKKDHNSWDIARKNNWLNEICSHMIELKKPKNYWNIEKCIIEAKKYNKSNELKKNNASVYKIMCKNKLIKNFYKNN